MFEKQGGIGTGFDENPTLIALSWALRPVFKSTTFKNISGW